jgi:zinc protease
MISYTKAILDNGLTALVHQDKSTPICAISVLYKVGSRDERMEQTGMAHLFEHLMFSGSKNAKNFDRYLQKAGGENNAFTNNDFTNYYGVLPANNLDILLWLESDRMADLVLNEKKLANQKSVVLEEFKETCLNEPYGDVWHHIASMAYQVHPYQWPVIGKEMEHIQNVQFNDVSDFYKRFYTPSNAILCISGPLGISEVFSKLRYWFESILTSPSNSPIYSQEPQQIEERRKTIHADVPANAIYLVFHAYDRQSPFYYTSDLISDILANGRSSRLYQQLVKDKELFTYIDAYITGTFDQGLLVIEGKLSPDIDPAKAEQAIWEVLDDLKTNLIEDNELQKLKNKAESALTFSELGIMHRAINLCFFEALGDADLINSEIAMYRSILPGDIQACAIEMLDRHNCSILWYLKSND